jgi:hypothetical protein
MAKQANGMRFRGTVGETTYYVMEGKGYARSKSNLTSKRVMKDKKFEKTRQYASSMGLASKIASPVYKALPLEVKGRWLFRAIAGEAASLLYEGKTEEEVTDFLWNKYIYAPMSLTDDKVTQPNKKSDSYASKQTKLELWKIFRDRWDIQGKPVSVFKRIWERRGVFKPWCIPKRLGIMPVV